MILADLIGDLTTQHLSVTNKRVNVATFGHADLERIQNEEITLGPPEGSVGILPDGITIKSADSEFGSLGLVIFKNNTPIIFTCYPNEPGPIDSIGSVIIINGSDGKFEFDLDEPFKIVKTEW